MSRITGIRTGRRTRERLNMYIDGQFAFSLEAEQVARQGLRVGQELSVEEMAALGRMERRGRCLDAAARLLAYRPRSEHELRERLRRRSFDDDSIESVISRLKDQGIVDDIAFARFWQESRTVFSPRSRWLIALELGRKGVAPEIIDEVLGQADDTENAYRAAMGKARKMAALDYDTFRQRLGEFLKRRGFGYQVIRSTTKRLWEERETPDRAVE